MPINRTLHDVDTTVVATLLMQQLEYAMCLECCSVYKDVETATCGHSLCGNCWKSQRVCSICMARATQRQRRLNIPLQTLATHSQALLHAFEKLFHITVDEHLNVYLKNCEETNKTVKNWIHNSQNKFNSPCEPHSEIVDLHFDELVKPIQNRYDKTSPNPAMVIYKAQSQTDWDKIETMSSTQIVHDKEGRHKDTQGPAYTCENPRRSSRNNKDSKTSLEVAVLNKENNGSSKSDSKCELSKRNWNSVKKMRKEFSKVNKIHRNKLNVSIENVKRAKSATKSTAKDLVEVFPQTPYVIDEESPLIFTHEQKSQGNVQGERPLNSNNVIVDQQNVDREIFRGSKNVDSDENNTLMTLSKVRSTISTNAGKKVMSNTDKPISNKILFFKKGKLFQFEKDHDTVLLKQMRCAACQTTEADNIFIDIKIGNVLTNIVINGKKDVHVKRQTCTQIGNDKANTIDDLHVTQQNKDEYGDFREPLVQIPDMLQDQCDLLEKISLPHDNVRGNSNNIVAQLKTVANQEPIVVLENIAKVGTATNIGSEELDIFNNTPTAREDVQFFRNTGPAPSELLNSVGEKRVRETDILAPSSKKARLSNYSSQPSPLNSQQSSEPAQPPHSENVFTLSEKLCHQSNKPHEPTTLNNNFETSQHDHGDKNDHWTQVDSISKSIIEESQCPKAVAVVTNTITTNVNDSVKTAKESTHHQPMEQTDLTRDTRQERVDHKSLPSSEIPTRARTLETPLSMTNFVNAIEHNSTPLARKSLRFEQAAAETDSVDATLCPTNPDGCKTQEREFISIESVPRQPTAVAYIPLPCVAGSNLKGDKLVQLKSLCTRLGWTFLENYSPKLTHLVVTVDGENRAQRTVKYICALAASKWVVSFAWVEQCASAGRAVPEEPFEALDLTGAPGPFRSRTATRQLFTGFTFHCMPPFTLLDIATLEGMLEASGGRVVESAAAARADGREPRLVLAESEPSQTPENRFIFMAMELSVVPISVDWLFDSLGTYELCPLREFLLCPATLVTEFARDWLPPLVDAPTDSKFGDETVPPSP